ncbi:MAG: hypothetical protein HKN39_02580 [Flavobacteriales bacterium]|nr:hypothetical protein [Flavobacteriales bacterium]
MKKLIGIALLVFAICVNVNAQSKVDRAEMEAKKLTKELGLTEEQIAKKAEIDASTMEQFQEINVMRQKIMEERKAMPQDATPEQREAINEKMKALRETQIAAKKLADERFQEILTEEQAAKYKELRTVKKAPVAPRPSKK